MSIDATTFTTPTTPTTKTATGQGLQGSKDEFLKLFMAQLQHQDPFAPTSGADMVAQLAQLSGVEQAKQTNSQLAELAASQASAASAGLSSLIGRNCDASVGAFSLDPTISTGAPPPVEVSSASPTKGASLVITDADGKTLAKVKIPDGTTHATLAWDGTDSSGKQLPAGSYKMTIDPGGSGGSINAQWQGRVEAVELTTDGPRLRMGGVLLQPGDIRTIGNLSSTPLPGTTTSTTSTTATSTTATTTQGTQP